jgi:hypothetical protein
VIRARPGGAWLGRGAAASPLPLYALLGGLTLALGLARLLTGPWQQLVNPTGGVLLEGRPAEWEVVYYLQHFPTLAGDGPPLDGFAAVHQRALVELYLAAGLYAWTGSAYWSIALVDLVGWAVAGIATYHLGLRLGVDRRAAALGSVLVVTSPLFASQMWMNVFHPAEFASLPLGLWAGLTLMERATQRARRGDGAGRAEAAVSLAGWLGLLLFGLSVTYQYQWIVLPLLVTAALTWPAPTGGPEGRGGSRVTLLLGLAGAVVVLVGATLALQGLLRVGGVPPGGSLEGAVSRADSTLLGRLRGEGPLALLPDVRSLGAMVAVYHPLVFAVAGLGLFVLPWRTSVLALVATAMSLVAYAQYSASWTAMSAYPFVYLAAGAACVRGGSLIQGVLGGRRSGVALGTAVLLVVVLAGVTNTDLWGEAGYARWWWSHYAPSPPY